MPTEAVWQELLDMAEAIPNLADRAFALEIIALCMPSGKGRLRATTLDSAFDVVGGIMAAAVRVEQYYLMAETAFGDDETFCRRCITAIREIWQQHGTNASGRWQREVVDLAYKLDPRLASSFASAFDKDPAREEAKRRFQQRIRVLDRKSRREDQGQSETRLAVSASETAEAFWLKLGALNAGRGTHVPLQTAMLSIQEIGLLNVAKSYPIAAWFIENAKQRLKDTDQVRTALRPIFESTISAAELSSKVVNRMFEEDSSRVALEERESDSNLLIEPGDRQEALEFILKWFSEDDRTYLKIADPYFGVEELPILKALSDLSPGLRIEVLTSREHQKNRKYQEPYSVAYSSYWRHQISDEEPPDIDISIISTLSKGQSPIHDRWWLSNTGGLEIGTSFNGLGESRYSTIRKMSSSDSLDRQQIVDDFLYRRKREHMGEKVVIEYFSIRL